MKKDKTKVKIEVTLKQAEYIRQCLEWSARCSIGQLESSHLPNEVEQELFGDPKTDKDWLYRRDLWDGLANSMKSILHKDLSRSYGASKSYSHSEFSRNCCSMQKMLAVKMKEFDDKDKKEEDIYWNVNSTFIDIYDCPVAKIEIIENGH
jgi:hypothetical protein